MTTEFLLLVLLVPNFYKVFGYGLFTEQCALQSAAKWCTKLTEQRIFTLGKWIHCPELLPEEPVDDVPPGLELRVAVLENVLDSMHDCWACREEGELVLKGSYSTFILELLQQLLEIKINITGTTSYGRQVDGNWTGLMGLVGSKKVDMAICHLAVTEERIESIDFLHSTLRTNRALVFSPRRLPLTDDVFVLTFSASLWLCFLVAIVLLIVCFRFSTWLHSKVRPDHEPWSWVEVILLVVASICQQSYSRHPKGLSCRTTFIIGYLITYLLYTAFAAGVTSLLAVQGQDIHLTFADVIAMKLTLLASTHTTNLPAVTTSPDSSTFWIRQNLGRLYNTKEVRNNDELFKGIEEYNVVGFGTAVNLNNYLWRRVPQHKKEEFTISEILNSYSQESFIIQKNSPYKEPLNYWLLRLQEAGLLSLGRSRYMTVPHQHCCDSPGWSSAGLGNVLSAVLILGAGYFFSIFILFCEMAWVKRFTSSKWEKLSKEDIFSQYAKYNKRRQRNGTTFRISVQGGNR